MQQAATESAAQESWSETDSLTESKRTTEAKEQFRFTIEKDKDGTTEMMEGANRSASNVDCDPRVKAFHHAFNGSKWYPTDRRQDPQT